MTSAGSPTAAPMPGSCRMWSTRPVPPAVDLPRSSRCSSFWAAFAYPPNQRAAKLLVDEIAARRRTSRIGGPAWRSSGTRRRPGSCRHAARRADIEVPGTVPSVRPWLERALAVVVPLREGGGTRFKILEAMAAGVPVVSTPKGIEGLDLVPGREALVGEDPTDLARLTVGLWHDADGGTAMAACARAVVELHHSYANAADRIRAALLARQGAKPDPDQLPSSAVLSVGRRGMGCA